MIIIHFLILLFLQFLISLITVLLTIRTFLLLFVRVLELELNIPSMNVFCDSFVSFLSCLWFVLSYVFDLRDGMKQLKYLNEKRLWWKRYEP